MNILETMSWLTNHSLYHMYGSVENLLFLAGAVLLGRQGGSMLFQKSCMLSTVILKCELPGLLNMELLDFSDSRIFQFILLILFLFKINYMQIAKELKERLPNDLDGSKHTNNNTLLLYH